MTVYEFVLCSATLGVVCVALVVLWRRWPNLRGYGWSFPVAAALLARRAEKHLTSRSVDLSHDTC